jgi:protein-disulfide isomerase
VRHLVVLAGLAAVGAYGMRAYHDVRAQAQSGGVAADVVREYFALEPVGEPSFISPFWTARATEDFADAPVRIVEYADLLCSDCRYLAEQMARLKEDFPGQLNVAFQFFPLEAQCNSVVEKDLHPGACEISYMAAHDPALFQQVHDEVFSNFQAAKTPEWRAALAERLELTGAPVDSTTRELVHRIIETGREFERTSEEFSHGIRSTPTMIINDRMVIGTLPYEQLKAIIQALIAREETGGGYMENWAG